MRQLKAYSMIVLLLLVMACHKKASTVNNSVKPNDFLSDKKYHSLIVEILYVNGFKPTDATIENLKNFLSERLNKSSGITVVETPISSPGKTTFTIDDVKEIENNFRTKNTSGRTLTACFFFADGDFASNTSNSKVFGISYGSSSMVIFEKTIRDYSGGITQPPLTPVESTVILHEFGHVLGLVNNGTTMQTPHEDSANHQHCDDKNCLMYYSVETSLIASNVLGTNIPQLNPRCVEDLRANGGK